jgi:hypothetical protein
MNYHSDNCFFAFFSVVKSICVWWMGHVAHNSKNAYKVLKQGTVSDMSV